VSDFVKLATIGEIKPGGLKTVDFGEEKVLLANVKGTIHAVSDACTHADFSLGGSGDLEDDHVICGFHGSEFSVVTGEVIEDPADQPLKVYQVRVEGEDIYVGP
jgi:3-phenylpropionate/trans-cinnamate dioxygenase ferredoxin subunit